MFFGLNFVFELRVLKKLWWLVWSLTVTVSFYFDLDLDFCMLVSLFCSALS